MSGQTLELHEISRSFGGRVAVDGLSFSVPPGRLFGFVGRNGAGKTTTMRIICGLLAPDRGTVSWSGGPIDGRVRERIGYMPEERGLTRRCVSVINSNISVFCTAHRTQGGARRRSRGWIG